MRRELIHESQFEPGDRVKYIGNVLMARKGMRGTVQGWYDAKTAMVAVRFDGETYNVGCYDVNLKFV